jgi:hypothetical protein
MGRAHGGLVRGPPYRSVPVFLASSGDFGVSQKKKVVISEAANNLGPIKY